MGVGQSTPLSPPCDEFAKWEYTRPRAMARDFHDKDFDFVIEERKVRHLLGGRGKANKQLAQQVIQKYSKNGVSINTLWWLASVALVATNGIENDVVGEVALTLFDMFDFEKSNDMNLDELTILLISTSKAVFILLNETMEPSVDKIESLTKAAFASVDKDGDNRLSKEEFVDWVKAHLPPDATVKGVCNLFKSITQDGMQRFSVMLKAQVLPKDLEASANDEGQLVSGHETVDVVESSDAVEVPLDVDGHKMQEKQAPAPEVPQAAMEQPPREGEECQEEAKLEIEEISHSHGDAPVPSHEELVEVHHEPGVQEQPQEETLLQEQPVVKEEETVHVHTEIVASMEEHVQQPQAEEVEASAPVHPIAEPEPTVEEQHEVKEEEKGDMSVPVVEPADASPKEEMHAVEAESLVVVEEAKHQAVAEPPVEDVPAPNEVDVVLEVTAVTPDAPPAPELEPESALLEHTEEVLAEQSQEATPAIQADVPHPEEQMVQEEAAGHVHMEIVAVAQTERSAPVSDPEPESMVVQELPHEQQQPKEEDEKEAVIPPAVELADASPQEEMHGPAVELEAPAVDAPVENVVPLPEEEVKPQGVVASSDNTEAESAQEVAPVATEIVADPAPVHEKEHAESPEVRRGSKHHPDVHPHFVEEPPTIIGTQESEEDGEEAVPLFNDTPAETITAPPTEAQLSDADKEAQSMVNEWEHDKVEEARRVSNAGEEAVVGLEVEPVAPKDDRTAHVEGPSSRRSSKEVDEMVDPEASAQEEHVVEHVAVEAPGSRRSSKEETTAAPLVHRSSLSKAAEQEPVVESKAKGAVVEEEAVPGPDVNASHTSESASRRSSSSSVLEEKANAMAQSVVTDVIDRVQQNISSNRSSLDETALTPSRRSSMEEDKAAPVHRSPVTKAEEQEEPIVEALTPVAEIPQSRRSSKEVNKIIHEAPAQMHVEEEVSVEVPGSRRSSKEENQAPLVHRSSLTKAAEQEPAVESKAEEAAVEEVAAPVADVPSSRRSSKEVSEVDRKESAQEEEHVVEHVALEAPGSRRASKEEDQSPVVHRSSLSKAVEEESVVENMPEEAVVSASAPVSDGPPSRRSSNEVNNTVHPEASAQEEHVVEHVTLEGAGSRRSSKAAEQESAVESKAEEAAVVKEAAPVADAPSSRRSSKEMEDQEPLVHRSSLSKAVDQEPVVEKMPEEAVVSASAVETAPSRRSSNEVNNMVDPETAPQEEHVVQAVAVEAPDSRRSSKEDDQPPVVHRSSLTKAAEQEPVVESKAEEAVVVEEATPAGDAPSSRRSSKEVNNMVDPEAAAQVEHVVEHVAQEGAGSRRSSKEENQAPLVHRSSLSKAAEQEPVVESKAEEAVVVEEAAPVADAPSSRRSSKEVDQPPVIHRSSLSKAAEQEPVVENMPEEAVVSASSIETVPSRRSSTEVNNMVDPEASAQEEHVVQAVAVEAPDSRRSSKEDDQPPVAHRSSLTKAAEQEPVVESKAEEAAVVAEAAPVADVPPKDVNNMIDPEASAQEEGQPPLVRRSSLSKAVDQEPVVEKMPEEAVDAPAVRRVSANSVAQSVVSEVIDKAQQNINNNIPAVANDMGKDAKEATTSNDMVVASRRSSKEVVQAEAVVENSNEEGQQSVYRSSQGTIELVEGCDPLNA